MLLNLEDDAFLLHLHAEHDVEVLSLRSSLLVVLAIHIEFRSVGILYVVASMLAVCFLVHAGSNELVCQFVHQVVLTHEVHHWASLTTLIDEEEGRYASGFCHLGVVSTECRSDVDNTRTVFSCDIIARNHTECLCFHFHELVFAHAEDFLRMSLCRCLYEICSIVIHLLARLHPRHQLLILHAHEVGTLEFSHDAVRHHLVAWLEFVHRKLCSFWLQIRIHKVLCHHGTDFLSVVWVVGLYANIINLWSHTKSCVRRQCPRSGGPCQEAWHTPVLHLRLWIECFEDGGAGGIFHITIATWLVQLVARKSCTCGRGIRLDGISLVEQVLVVELLEEIPKGFDIFVIVCDVRMLQVAPIAHLLAEFAPFRSVHHYVLSAALIVCFDGNGLADVFLCDAEFLLHTELHRESVGVPTRLALHLEALHGLIAVDGIFQCASHHMVDAWMTVC